jgi:hypothetical protein
MVTIKFKLPNLTALVDQAVRQVPFAQSTAINQTARDVQAALVEELPRVFDRPTPYIRNSIRITTWARKGTPIAVIEPKYPGGKGVDPQKVLEAEVFGGTRRYKRAEVALQRVGILPMGFYIVPGSSAPLDEYGNVKGSFIVQLLSYFQAFSEQGYRANMTAKRKSRLAKAGRTAQGFRTINGVEYFVSYGRLRSLSMASDHYSSLHPGIWARSGIHGSTVKPILLFVPNANYRVRYDFPALGERVALERFPINFEAAMAAAMRTAR